MVGDLSLFFDPFSPKSRLEPTPARSRVFAAPKKSFALLASFPYGARSAPIDSYDSEGYLSLLGD